MSIVSPSELNVTALRRGFAATGQGERLLHQRRVAEQLSEVGVEASPPQGRLRGFDHQRRNGIDVGKECSQLIHEKLVRVLIFDHSTHYPIWSSASSGVRRS